MGESKAGGMQAIPLNGEEISWYLDLVRLLAVDPVKFFDDLVG